MLKSSLLAVTFLAAGQAASAQTPPPGAGEQLQQIPPAEVPRTPAPDLRIERPGTDAQEVPSGARVRVEALHVTGNTLFPEAELIAATGVSPGAELTLPELRNAAAAIAAFYNRQGYILAQAYLAPQEIRDGAVTITVIEGRYGAVGLRNQTTLSDGVARRRMRGLHPGDPVAIAPLERSLLLLSDLPGVAVRSTLAPGSTPGASDLTVELTPGRRVTGSVEADNAGNRYTGAYRLGGTINLNNPTGHGDRLSLRLLASTEDLAFGRLAYEAPFGDGMLGLAYTHMRYQLGQEFDVLDAGGTADIVSLYGAYPLIRSRRSNLDIFASVDDKRLKDDIGLASLDSRRSSRALSVGLRGDSRDGFGGGGWSAFSVTGTTGSLDIENPAERLADSLAGQTNGNFGKAQFSVMRLQTVSGPLSLFGAVRGQVAFNNLDSSEKMELGGAYGVRAYPEGEAYGDEGYIATLEARLALDRWTSTWPGHFQLIGFVDAGRVNFAHDAWSPGSNSARRSGAGVGLAWMGPGNLTARVTYAARLGDQPATSAPDRSGRVWFQITKQF
ncbi:MAG: ShlB/FhaC/HecB family hemolysin secretion/activation protein [Caulobacter sp.]|nr:ShlB/FhaC/HecB family hemolysin secretion/activation protein [Caulobacter sp.]